MKTKKWVPLEKNKLNLIKELFHKVYPATEYGDLAERIGGFWVELLAKSWEEKPEKLKALDLGYDTADPLSRVMQKTVVITYADSIVKEGEKTLVTLDRFLGDRFPNLGGLHLLPACGVVEDRFNDGYFSQVERNRIHEAFGTDDLFADMVHRYFSMNDLVMGHVDIENPAFNAYLRGDDQAGETFYVFSESEYKDLKARGSFENVFRPRPFPLFTIFRRFPESEPWRSMELKERMGAMKELISRRAGLGLHDSVIGILYVFSKVKNDQMLLEEDYLHVRNFRQYLEDFSIDPDKVFTESVIQEVRHVPYIFKPGINTRDDLLAALGFNDDEARRTGEIFDLEHEKIFGEEVRVLTTFSHVQADVNTSTFEGLKRFAEDLVWYLTKDLNMLRLDAVNYAFKKWGTSCFGLSELDLLMKIVYLSMECISPRMIPNLEVNDSLTTILNQMSSGDAPPPMMHDFYLASLLPAVFHTGNPDILKRIFERIGEYRVPETSIRFSLSESHDGKSVRGSMDLLTYSERRILTEAVLHNGGFVKYKSIPRGKCPLQDFVKFCGETGLNPEAAGKLIFDQDSDRELPVFRQEIKSLKDVLELVPELKRPETGATSAFFFERLFTGRDPYELCITTRDCLPVLADDKKGLEADRFLAFQTLALAVMGRNVKTIYFNDLLGLPNDYGRVKKSGELRDIKRTKSDYDQIIKELDNPGSFISTVAGGINDLIGIVDSDPAMHFRGSEAEVLETPDGAPAAAVLNRCERDFSITLVNLSDEPVEFELKLPELGGQSPGRYDPEKLSDRISSKAVEVLNRSVRIRLEGFGRMWLSPLH